MTCSVCACPRRVASATCSTEVVATTSAAVAPRRSLWPSQALWQGAQVAFRPRARYRVACLPPVAVACPKRAPGPHLTAAWVCRPAAYRRPFRGSASRRRPHSSIRRPPSLKRHRAGAPPHSLGRRYRRLTPPQRAAARALRPARLYPRGCWTSCPDYWASCV